MSSIAATGFGIVTLILLLLVCLFVWLIARKIARWIDRSIKPRQDLARSVADVGEKLERIENRLERLIQGRE